jgi:hypothetical protein
VQEEGLVPCVVEDVVAEVRPEAGSQEAAEEEDVVRRVVEALVQDEAVPEEVLLLDVELREVVAPLVAVVASAVAAAGHEFRLMVRSAWSSG